MSENTPLQCAGRVLVRRMQEFLSLPSTNTSAEYKTHWQNLAPASYRTVEIKDCDFSGANRITCIARDAYNLFKDFLNNNCHNVFRAWKDGAFDVDFWIIDNPSV